MPPEDLMRKKYFQAKQESENKNPFHIDQHLKVVKGG
jgi:hypothetical protein